ncbi:MAG TPA: hypothetical protein VJQ52_16630, partial [Steroidobacteraceae bacterium]|nr:hypothetical protein [Steroidobacteraceae bacterium]
MPGASFSQPCDPAGEAQNSSGASSMTSFSTKNVRICRTPGRATRVLLCNRLKSCRSRTRTFRKYIILKEDYAYPAYGVPSEQTNEAMRLCARMEGMITDPVYEGKSMQGL